MNRGIDPHTRLRTTPRLALLSVILGLPSILLLLSAPATAQTGPDDRVAEFIERTAEIIDQAAQLVLETENQQARRILHEARGMHQRSLRLLDHGQRRQALAVSQRAREAARHAARLARETHGQQERFLLRLERFHELRDQLRERAHEVDDERVLRFLREADLQALRAMDHHHQGNNDLALHLLQAAEELLARATRLLHEGFGGERLEREFERTRSLLEHTAAKVEEAPARRRNTSADLLQSAAEALRRAEGYQGRQQPVRAWHALRLARQLTAQAAAASAEPTHPDDVAAQIARWDERHEEAAGTIQEDGSPAALAILERARHHRHQAERRLEAGDAESALRQLRAAFDLLNEAIELSR